MPWCWAINGFASVVATVGAVLLAMEIGLFVVAVAGAGAYLIACSVWGAAPDEETDQSKPARSGLTL